MNIGEQISKLRKSEGMSQDDFAEMLHVSRQTVSNWENGKSYPDLEMIISISDHFGISVDELLKSDHLAVKNIDSEKKKKNKYLVLLIIVLVLGSMTAFGAYLKYQDSMAVDFTMEKEAAYQGKETESSSMYVAEGYFSVPADEKIDIKADASTDDGKLHIVIRNTDGNIIYRLDGEKLKDQQTLHVDKGSYIIQITADDHSEDVITIAYNIKISS